MPKITALYAWVMADADENDEGVPAFKSPAMPGMALPMMGADIERAGSMREIAQRMATETGKPLKLIRSTGIEVVEEVLPNA